MYATGVKASQCFIEWCEDVAVRMLLQSMACLTHFIAMDSGAIQHVTMLAGLLCMPDRFMREC